MMNIAIWKINETLTADEVNSAIMKHLNMSNKADKKDILRLSWVVE